ncbi:MAG TPA: secretin N-terminal domain-containing protein [Candidatus Sumerlaeota bacterium]|nr:secretin N-terminal domain-containing protein [Candidatus Sumerlaeota bacterium]
MYKTEPRIQESQSRRSLPQQRGLTRQARDPFSPVLLTSLTLLLILQVLTALPVLSADPQPAPQGNEKAAPEGGTPPPAAEAVKNDAQKTTSSQEAAKTPAPPASSPQPAEKAPGKDEKPQEPSKPTAEKAQPTSATEVSVTQPKPLSMAQTLPTSQTQTNSNPSDKKPTEAPKENKTPEAQMDGKKPEAPTDNKKPDAPAENKKPEGQPDNKATTPPAEKDKKINLNLKNVQMDLVVQLIANKTQKPVFLNKAATPAISVMVPKPVTEDEAIELVYEALLLEGVAVIESPDKVQIIPAAEIKQQDIATVQGPLPDDLRPHKARIARQIVTLRAVNATAMKTQIEPLLTKFGSISADDHTNKLVIVDTVRNLEQFERILKEFDITGFDNLKVQTIPLTYAEADEVCNAVLSFIQNLRTAAAAAGGAPDTSGRRKAKGPGNIVLTPLPRTNSILMAAEPEDTQQILDLVKILDVEKPKDAQVHIIEIERADVRELAQAAQALYPFRPGMPEKERVIIMPTGIEKSLLIFANEAKFQLVRDTLKQLDSLKPTELTRHTVQLQRASKDHIQELIGQLFPPTKNTSEKERITIVDPGTPGTLIFVCSDANFEKVKQVISEFDTERPAETEPHIVNLERADSDDVAETIRQLYGFRRNAGPKERVLIINTGVPKSFIVVASKENFEAIQQLIKQLDQETPKTTKIHMVQLQIAEESDIIQTVTALFPYTPWRRNQAQKDNVQVIPTGIPKSLIVVASDENFTVIQDIITKLDTEKTKEVEPHFVKLELTQVGEIIPILTPLFPATGKNIAPKDRVQFIPSNRPDTLIVVCSKENLAAIQELIKQLDTEDPQKIQARNIPIQKANVYQLIETLRPMFYREMMAGSSAPGTGGVRINERDRILMFPTPQLDGLMVISSEENFQRVKTLAEKLDQEQPREVDVNFVKLERADPATVAATLTPILASRRTSLAERDKVQIIPAGIESTLIVVASKQNFEMVQKLIKELDQEKPRETQIRVIPIERADVATLIASLSQIFPVKANQAARDKVQLFPSAQLDGLIVVSSEENYKIIQELVAKLDSEKPREVNYHIVQVTRADPAILAQTLTPLFPVKRNQAEKERVQVYPAGIENTLIVVSNEENFKVVQNLITQLDQEKPKERDIRVVAVERADVSNLVASIMPLFTGKRNLAEKDKVELIPTAQKNGLIVVSSEENFKVVENLVKQLDAEEVPDVKPHIVTILRADPSLVSETITRLFPVKPNQAQKDRVVIFPAGIVDTAIVVCSDENLKIIEPLIQQLDQDKPLEIQPHIMNLSRIDPAEAVQALTPMFRARRNMAEKDRVEFSAVPGNSKLVVMCSDENFKVIEQLVVEIDNERPLESKFHVITLERAKPADVAESLAPLFRTKPNMAERDRVQIAAGINNTLLVTASEENFAIVQELVRQLDADKPLDAKIHILDVQYANVRNLTAAIMELFPARRAKSEKDKVQVIPSGTDEALVVVCSDENYKVVQELVAKLDTEKSQPRETRSFVLKYLDSQETAEELGELYGSLNPRRRYSDFGFSDYDYGYGGGRSGYDFSTDKEVKFVPVGRTNTIMVLAPPSEFELIESLIAQIDQPIQKADVLPRIYKIKNGDAAEMEKVLNNIFSDRNTNEDSYSSYRWRPNAQTKSAVGRLSGKVTFSADPNTNSIIATTNNKANYDIIDEVVREIDHPNPELANTVVIALKHAIAAELAAELNALFGKPVQGAQLPQQNRGQQTETEEGPGAFRTTSAARDLFFGGWWSDTRQTEDRQVSNLIGQVRFVPDVRTNALLVTTAAHNVPVIEELISNLDRNEPQVQVTARVLEIRKEKNKQLGLRWAPDPSLYSSEDLDGAIKVLSGLEIFDSFGSNGVGKTLNSGGTLFNGGTYTNSLAAGKGIIGADVNMTLLLQLLDKNLDSSFHSKTDVYISNNKVGRIFAGDDIMRREGTNTTPQGGVQDILKPTKVGITLEITPHINTSDTVVMTIFMKTSQLLTGDNIQERQYETEVAVNNNATVVMGGIALDTQKEIIRKTPVLSDIPLVGRVFTNKNTQNTESKVYVLLTPFVTEHPREATQHTNEIRAIMKEAEPTSDSLPTVTTN